MNPSNVRQRIATLVVLVACLAGCASTPPNPNPNASKPLALATVDLPRYMGRWFVIAHIPYFGERGFVASRAEWKLRDDGKIDDSFFARKDSFTAKETSYEFTDTVVPGSGNAHWKVRLFFPIVVSQYTLYVDPDYKYTLVSSDDRKYGWIFARERTIPEAKYRELLGRMNDMGFDTARFRRVPQEPDQLGQPGFETPGQKDD